MNRDNGNRGEYSVVLDIEDILSIRILQKKLYLLGKVHLPPKIFGIEKPIGNEYEKQGRWDQFISWCIDFILKRSDNRDYYLQMNIDLIPILEQKATNMEKQKIGDRKRVIPTSSMLGKLARIEQGLRSEQMR